MIVVRDWQAPLLAHMSVKDFVVADRMTRNERYFLRALIRRAEEADEKRPVSARIGNLNKGSKLKGYFFLARISRCIAFVLEFCFGLLWMGGHFRHTSSWALPVMLPYARDRGQLHPHPP